MGRFSCLGPGFARLGDDRQPKWPRYDRSVSGASWPWYTVQDTVVLDGEIVMLSRDGVPDFAALWFRGRSGKSSEDRLCYMAFDLLQVGAEELIDRPYTERRALLEDLQLDGPHWCSPPSYIGDGSSVFAATKRMGLEGVVAKRVDSRYQPGVRSRRLSTQGRIAVAGVVESGYGSDLVEQLPRLTRRQLRALQMPGRGSE